MVRLPQGDSPTALPLEDDEGRAQPLHLILDRRQLASLVEQLEDLHLAGFAVPVARLAHGVEDLVDQAGNLTLWDDEIATAECPAPVGRVRSQDVQNLFRRAAIVRHAALPPAVPALGTITQLLTAGNCWVCVTGVA